jgi:hypothetical protein
MSSSNLRNRTFKPQLEPLETRLVPTTLTAHGGPVVATPKLFDVFVQSSQPAMNQLAPVLVGPYTQMFAAYGIHPGTFVGSATLSLSASVVHDTDIRSLLTKNIHAGTLPQPGPNQIYMIYLAPGQTLGDNWTQGDVGYHSAFRLDGKWVYYGVVLSQNDQSVPASHEFAEILTDPIVGTGWFAGNIAQEEGDLENWKSFTLDGFDVTLVTLPNGQVLPTPQVPDTQDLNALLTERFFADLWGFLARLSPVFFAGRAQQAQQTLAANPTLNTDSGQANVALADQFFASWLSQQQLG